MTFLPGDMAFINARTDVWSQAEDSNELVGRLNRGDFVLVLSSVHKTRLGYPYYFIVGNACGWVYAPRLDNATMAGSWYDEA